MQPCLVVPRGDIGCGGVVIGVGVRVGRVDGYDAAGGGGGVDTLIQHSQRAEVYVLKHPPAAPEPHALHPSCCQAVRRADVDRHGAVLGEARETGGGYQHIREGAF